MPLTDKGQKILKSMMKTYGSKKGKGVFYASINKGTVTGAEGRKKKSTKKKTKYVKRNLRKKSRKASTNSRKGSQHNY